MTVDIYTTKLSNLSLLKSSMTRSKMGPSGVKKIPTRKDLETLITSNGHLLEGKG
jgi:hypothetical protein